MTFTPTDTTDYTTTTATATINVAQGDAHDQLVQPGEHRLRDGTGKHAARRDGKRAGDIRLRAGLGHGTQGRQWRDAESDIHADRHDRLHHHHRHGDNQRRGKATPTISWSNPANIVYGTALGGTQLDATASVAGTFAYAPASGTVLKAGNGRR